MELRPGLTYLFGASHHLLKEEDVDGVHFRQVGLALLGEEQVDVSFR
jgi:hypothetical protein